jgi:hypothetical protein
VALAIAEANAGSEIRRTELDLLFGLDAETAVRAGHVTGILVESLDRDPEAPALIRFESHRAQEYFAAYAIALSTEHFDWSARLDVPRWQETLVNLAQMGKAAAAIGELTATLQLVPALWEDSADLILRNWAEIEAAERVDLAARVIRDLPSTPEREELREVVTEAAQALIEKGTSVSKAAVLRTVQQAPEIGGSNLIAPVLQDKSGWVRDQAYVVQSRLAGPMAILSVLQEVGLAYAEGELLGRLPRYLTLARKLKSSRLALTAIAGAALQGLSLALAAAVGPGLVFVVLHLISTNPELEPIFRVFRAPLLEHGYSVQLGAVILAAALAVFIARLDMRRAIFWLSIAGIGFVCVPTALGFIWQQAPDAKPSTLFFILLFIPYLGYLVFLLGSLLCLLIWGACALSFIGVVLLATRSDSSLARRILSTGWEASNLGNAVQPLLWLAILPIVFIYAVLAKLIEPWVEAVADRIGLSTFYSSWWSYVVLTLLLWLGYILLFPLISPIRTRRSFDFVRDFREGAKSWRLVAIGLVWIAGSLVVGKIFSFLGDLLKMLDRFSFRLAYILYALVLLLSLALLAALVFVTYSLLRPVLQQMQRIAGQTKHIDIVQWMEDVRDSTPGQQAWLLGTADPARFGISLEETIEAFASLQSEIHQEPARSAYDARMNELVAIRRQRRTG